VLILPSNQFTIAPGDSRVNSCLSEAPAVITLAEKSVSNPQRNASRSFCRKIFLPPQPWRCKTVFTLRPTPYALRPFYPNPFRGKLHRPAGSGGANWL